MQRFIVDLGTSRYTQLDLNMAGAHKITAAGGVVRVLFSLPLAFGFGLMLAVVRLARQAALRALEYSTTTPVFVRFPSSR